MSQAHRLSEGVLVEGTVVARLLGMRILTLETRVTLVPPPVLPRRSTSDVPPVGRELATARRVLDAGRSNGSGARVA